MSLPSISRPTAPPSAASLMAGRIFTAVVFVLIFMGLTAALTASDNAAGQQLARIGFVGAALIYTAGSLFLFLRGDYILGMFGCAWPIILPRVDEMQKAQRQRAFSFTFIVFLSAFSVGIGAHFGALLAQRLDGAAVQGILPAQPWPLAAVLVFVFFTLALLPQAFLAWTLKPLNAEDAE